MEDSICGPGIVNISVTGAGAGETIDWYEVATNGTVLTGGSATANFTTPSINNTTTYYAELRNTTTGCVSGARIPVDARVNSVPSNSLVAVNGSNCGEGTVNLSVTGSGTGETIDWYASETGGSVLIDGLGTINYTTPLISVTTTYYAELRNSTTECISVNRIPVIATIDSFPLINLGNDTSICIDRNITFTVANIYPDYLWSTNETSNTITVDTAGQFSVRVTDGNGCIGRDTINLSIDSLPVINLGNDTSICIDKNIVFRVPNIYPDYLWSNTSTVDSILVNQAGEYSVRVIDGNGCIGRDTINLGIYQLPTPRLLNDTNICRGDSVQIGVQNFYVSYNWRTGQITDSIIINSAATYLVTVVDINGCVASDSVAIGILELPVVTLGNDTSICIESDYLLNAGNQGVDYLWSTGATSTTISTNGANEYWVRVINGDGCTTRDTINVDNHPSPAMTLNIPDTNICLLDTITLDGGVWDEYQWNYNSSVNQTVNVFAAGTYILTVKNQFGCATSDTTVVGIYQLPNSNLGPDREVCLYKNVDITVPENNATYLWSTNENTQSISTNLPGEYSVIVTNINGCSTRDTIVLNPGIDLIIDLGPDQNICPGETFTMELFGYDSLYWSTGEETERIVVSNTQKVDVLAVDGNGCWGRDTVQITSVPNPTVQLRNDTTICELEQESVELAVNNLAWSVEWNTGSTNQSITINYPGTFIVEVTDENNCKDIDTVVISPYCRPVTITMSNFFTPNNDGFNDYFSPIELTFEDRNYILLNLKYIHFEVYNRWGQKVHGSSEILPNWNGFSDLGGIAPTGTYFWVLEYELINGERHKKNGYVQLVAN